MEFIERSLMIQDLETTGLDPLQHEVIGLGALRVNQATLEVESEFAAKIKPFWIENADPIALEVNGFRMEDYEDAPWAVHVWPEFFEWARESVFSSWSTRFDWGFTSEAIKRFYPRTGHKDRDSFGPFDRHLIDLPSIAWGVLGPQPKLNKDKIAIALGLLPEAQPHTALAGAYHALEVLRALRERQIYVAQAA
jgi:DNA polymerase-3 subunit epsilon